MSYSIRVKHLFADINDMISGLSSDYSAVTASRKTLEGSISKGQAVYGVNTGFGKLANK